MKYHQLRLMLALWLFVAAEAPAAVRYVDLNSASPMPPYTNWATAATNIQDAVDAAVAGDQILVTNGVYDKGGRGSSRVFVDKPILLQSVNGPAATQIVGENSPNGTLRCVHLADGAVLSGFTLTNGAAYTSGYDIFTGSGGGVRAQSSAAIVSNCVFAANEAYFYGGGTYNARLINCTLTGNHALYGGGAFGGTLLNCTLTNNSAYNGGGAASNTLDNCTLSGNTASRGGGAYRANLVGCVLDHNTGNPGGGADGGSLSNCTLTYNSAIHNGGGASDATLVNCTLSYNYAELYGGGAYGGTLKNCIVYYNTAHSSIWSNDFGASLNYSCAPRPAAGAGNITNAPLFVDAANGDFRLQSNSPCINAGLTVGGLGTTDLDGNPRVAGVKVDIGANEFQGVGLSDFTGWLWGYGLRVDGSADYSDADSDLLNNWQEWIAGTIPTDAVSALRLFSPSNGESGITVSWQSVTNRTYFLERATNLGAVSPFSLVTNNITGQAGTTSYTDTNAVGPGPLFYRVGVQ